MRKQDMGNQFSKKTRKKAGSIQAQRIFRSRWFKSLVAMGSAVVFFTVYSLIIPAATLTEDQAAADSGIVLEEPAPSEPQVVETEEAPAPEPVAQAAVEETPAAASEETATQTPAEETGTAPSTEQGTSESAAAGSGSEETKETGTKDDAPADTADLNQTASAVDTTETASDGIETEEADAALTEEETAEDAATESSEESAEETTEEEEIGTVSELKAASGNLEALVRFADGAGIPENASLVIYGAGADTGKVQDALWSGSMDSIERSSITTDLSEYVSFAVKDADGNDITPDSDCSIEISFGSEANLSDPGENRIRKYGSLVVSSDGTVSVTGTDLSTGNGHTYATFTGTLSGNTFGFAVTTADRKVNYLESLSGKTSDGAVEAALSFGKDAKVPEGSSLTVETASVNESSVLDKFWGDEEGVNRDTAKADDIRFVKFAIRDRNGNEVRPETRVSVKLTFHHEADLSEAAEGFVKKHNALAAGPDGTITLGSGALSAGNGITTVSFADVSAKSAFGYAVTTAEKKIVYATKLTGKSEDGSIEASLRLTEEAKIPEGSILKVTPVTGESVRKTLLDNIWTDTSIIDPDTIKLTDSGLATVTITDKDGKVRKPEADAVLTLTFNKKADLAEAARKMVKRARAVEMTDENVKLSDSGLSVAEGKTRISYTGIVDGQTFGYAVSTAKQKTNFLDGKLSYEGEDYTIEVSVSKDNQIPENSKLNVKELDKDSEEFKKKLDQATEAIQKDAEKKSSDDIETSVDDASVRMFDITILNEDGDEIQPNGNVRVSVQYKNAVKVGADAKMKAVHFDEKNDEVQVLTPETKADTSDTEKKVHEVRFNANGFSVYAIVGTDNVKVSTITATTTDGASVEITGRLPKGAEASITPVALTTDELVSYYGESVINAVDNIVVYDICILVDGEEWEPDETVSVIIKSPAIETKESNEEVTVTHLIDEDMSAEKMDTELTDDGSISFETEGFSLWGLYTFTVDFYFGEQEYHMPGNTQMLLSELFEKLEIESPISDVINVTFSDENLLQIEKNENDWTLTSLLPFDTDENLQVELADGTILTILTKDKLSYPTYTYESEWLQPYVGTFRELGHIDIFGGGNGIACMSRENQVNEENWADRAKGAANNSTSTNYTYDQWTKGSWGGGTSFLNDRFDPDYSYQNTSSPKLFFKFDKINGKANGNDQNGAPLVGESGVFKSGSSAVITWDSPVGDEDTKTIRQAYFSFGYQAENNVSYTLDLYGPKGGRTQVTINTGTRKTDTSRAGNDNIGTSWAYLTFNASNFVKDQGFGTYTLVATIQPATSGNFTLCDMGWSIYGVLEDEAVPYAAVVGMIEEKTINPSLTPVVNFEEPVKVAGSGKVWFNVQGGEAKSPVNNTDADYLEVRTGTNTYRSFGSGGAYGGDITIKSIKPSATSDSWYYNDIAKPNHEQTAPPDLTNFDNCFSFGLCQYSGMTDSYVYGVRKRMESGNDVFGSMMLLTEVNTSPVTVSLKELDLDGNGVTSQLPSSGKSETFHFKVEALNGAPPPERTEYTANFQGGETDKDQLEILLGPFGFNSPGIYQYEIREIPGSSPYWSYDRRTLLLTLTVTLNTDATLDVASKLTVKDPENGESEEPVFINQYSLPVCLRLTKKNTDGQTLSGAVFELTAEGESSVYSDRSCETAATSLTTDSKGELVFYGLRKEKTYTLKETTAPNGYILDDTEITIMFDVGKNKWVYIVNGKTSYLTSSVAEDDIGAIGTLKIERTDKRQVMDIGVLKVDETNVARTLPGAEFELTRSDTANGTYERYTVDTAHATNGVYTSGADGRFTMTLPEGYYKLTEVSPPAGYITLQSEIPFQVVDQKGDKVVISDTNYVSLQTNQNTILIKNPYGDALPLTGGTGTQPYTLGGLALIVTVALMYGFRLRRRERRLNE